MKQQLIITSLLILIGHGLGMIPDLYNVWPWFDAPMHILGGFWVATIIIAFSHKIPGLAFINVSATQNPRPKTTFLVTLLIIVSLTMFVGLVWEFYEYGLDNLNPYSVNLNNKADIMADLFFDFVGAAIAGTAFLTGRRRLNSSSIRESGQLTR